MGRPWAHTEEEREALVNYVLERLVEGIPIAKTLEIQAPVEWIDAQGNVRSALRPSMSQWARWQSSNISIREAVAHARAAAADAYVDEAVSIADNSNPDLEVFYSRKQGKHIVKVNGEAIARSRLRAEMRLKVAAMIAPQTYGDKLDITSAGKALEAPPAVVIDQRIQSIMLKAAERKAIGKSALLDD